LDMVDNQLSKNSQKGGRGRRDEVMK